MDRGIDTGRLVLGAFLVAVFIVAVFIIRSADTLMVAQAPAPIDRPGPYATVRPWYDDGGSETWQ
jgi:hypothetical protein